MELQMIDLGTASKIALQGRLDTPGVDQIETRFTASVVAPGKHAVGGPVRRDLRILDGHSHAHRHRAFPESQEGKDDSLRRSAAGKGIPGPRLDQRRHSCRRHRSTSPRVAEGVTGSGGGSRAVSARRAPVLSGGETIRTLMQRELARRGCGSPTVACCFNCATTRPTRSRSASVARVSRSRRGRAPARSITPSSRSRNWSPTSSGMDTVIAARQPAIDVSASVTGEEIVLTVEDTGPPSTRRKPSLPRSPPVSTMPGSAASACGWSGWLPSASTTSAWATGIG